MAIIKKSTNKKCWRGCGGKRSLLHCWLECKLGQPLRRTIWRFLKKLERELPNDPAIPLLDIYLEKTIYDSQDTKQPRCPLTDEWIKKLWYIYAMEYNSALENEFESVLLRWTNLEPALQTSKSESKKQILNINAYIWNVEK